MPIDWSSEDGKRTLRSMFGDRKAIERVAKHFKEYYAGFVLSARVQEAASKEAFLAWMIEFHPGQLGEWVLGLE